MRKADNLTTTLGYLNFLEPSGHLGPVMGLIYHYILTVFDWYHLVASQSVPLVWYPPLDAVPVQTIAQLSLISVSLTERNSGTIKKTAHLELILRLSSKNKETTSHNSGIWRGMFQLTGVSVLSDAVVAFYSSIIQMPISGLCHCWIQ